MVKKRIPEKINTVVQDYVRRLIKKDKLPVDKVIIFGSQTKGRFQKWSDIDVCIISPKFKDSFEALEYLWTKREDQEVKYGLEPVGFSSKDFQEGGSVIQEIKKTGILLKI